MDEKSKLETSDTNRQKCYVCKKCIPKEVERLNVPYDVMGTIHYKRICGLCIINVYKKLNKRPVNNWRAEMVAKAI